MSDAQQTTQQQQDSQYAHMAAGLAEDLKILQAELQEQKRLREEAEKRESDRMEYLKQLEANVEQVKTEKKEQYGKILAEDVNPFFAKMKEQAKQDPKLVGAIEQMENTLKTGHENAFMKPEEQNTLRLVSAIASADAIRSSDLERLLKTEAEWGAKYEDLMKQKTELEEQTAAKAKELEEASALKEKMVEDLKKELEELKAQASKDINNSDAHFEKKEETTEDAPKAMETDSAPSTESAPPVAAQAPVVQATASNHRRGGIDTLFDFRPRTNWRTQFPDPGMAPSRRNN